MYDSKGFTYFAWLRPSKAGHGFMASFTDKDGEHRFLSRGKDSRGDTLFRRFKFKRSKRMISIPNSQADVINFLREYPDCEGSPNGSYAYDEHGKPIQIGSVYKEVNDGKDAKEGVEATKIRTKAMTHALGLEDEEKSVELKEIAIMTGYYNQDPGLQHWHLLNYAEANPDEYLEIVDDPTRRAKYIIKNGIQGGVLRRKGFMYYWEEIHLGNNFDEVVQNILSDKNLLEAIDTAIGKAGL